MDSETRVVAGSSLAQIRTGVTRIACMRGDCSAVQQP